MNETDELIETVAERVNGLMPASTFRLTWPHNPERVALVRLAWLLSCGLRANAEEIGAGPIESLIEDLEEATFRDREVALRQERTTASGSHAVSRSRCCPPRR